jgi:hypothetical protein
VKSHLEIGRVNGPLPGMSVEIAEEKDVFFKDEFRETEKSFRVKNLRMDQLVRISPPTVQVLAGQSAPVAIKPVPVLV